MKEEQWLVHCVGVYVCLNTHKVCACMSVGYLVIMRVCAFLWLQYMSM